MNRRFLRAAAGMALIYMSTALPPVWAGAPGTVDAEPQCGGEPCPAVFRGFVAFFDRDLEESQDYNRVSAQYPSGVLLENDRVTLAVSGASSTWALHQVVNEIVALGMTAQFLAIKSGDDPTVSGDI